LGRRSQQLSGCDITSVTVNNRHDSNRPARRLKPMLTIPLTAPSLSGILPPVSIRWCFVVISD
jgi:hypothetical protein